MLIGDDGHLVAFGAEAQHRAHEVLRGRAEEPRAADDPRLVARGGLAVQLRPAVRAERARRIRLHVRRPLGAVEHVVARPDDEWRAERCSVLHAADVHRCGALRIVFGTVDVRPGGRVQHELRALQAGRRRVGHVPIGARQSTRAGELLGERVTELPGRTGDYCVARRSRSDRMGDRVLQRSTTRGSFHGTPCSSGLDGSYSSVTK